MKPNDHIVSVWGDITAFVIAPLLILATVLCWPSGLRIALTVAFGVSILGLRLAGPSRSARRRRRA